MPNLSSLGLPVELLYSIYESPLTQPLKMQDVCSTKQTKVAVNTAPKNTQQSSNHSGPSLATQVQWHTAWSQYVGGCVVSKSAAQLIQSFLIQTMAGTSSTQETGAGSDGQESEDDPEVPPLTLASDKLQGLICPKNQSFDNALHPEATTGQKLKKLTKKRSLQIEHENSMRLAYGVWCTADDDKEARDRDCPGNKYAENFEDHLAARRERTHKGHSSAPFNLERNAAASWHRQDGDKHLDKVLETILTLEDPPNTEQTTFLKHFVDRLKVELLERLWRSTESTTQEPLLDLVHGFPGTGKSKLIEWMRQLMEDGLGWEHGIQFVCLAFQNAMAAQINGFTVTTGVVFHVALPKAPPGVMDTNFPSNAKRSVFSLLTRLA